MYHIGMKSAEQLLALINDTNSLTLTPDDVSFGTPSVITEADQLGVENPANTRITMSSKPNRFPIGDVSVDYDRIDLAEFESLGDPDGITLVRPLTYPRLIQAFNTFYGAALELIDVDTTAPLNVDEAGSEVIELHASPDSLAYRGSLIMEITVMDIPLDTVITITRLNGLVFTKKR